MRAVYCVIAGVLLALSGSGYSFAQTQPAATHSAANDLTLTGTITGAQSGGYVHVPFQAPPGMERITVTFGYTNHEHHSILDIGMRDPERFRGWSGGDKSEFTIGIADATPSYLPGLIVPGTWQLLIGVANVRPGQSTRYTAHIHFTPVGQAGLESFTVAPLSTQARWYRGDLHMHTAHSDGTCPSQTGKTVPCPVFVTVEQAVAHHLDFIAITDHNTESQYDVERELQPYFDKLLMIPGRELTTYYGHANLFGTMEYIDFEVGQRDTHRLYREAHALGAYLSLNHPVSKADCIGCSWKPAGFDMHLPDFIEVINDSDPVEHTLDVAFWQKQLDAGIRVPGIGGSDTHRPMETHGGLAGVGVPTTVVYASELSVPAVLAGMKAGHVFIDVAGTTDRMLVLTADAAGRHAAMGDELYVPTNAGVTLSADVEHCEGLQFEWLIDGHAQAAVPLGSAGQAMQTLHWTSDGRQHEIRAMVMNQAGEIEMVANPVYFNWPTGAKQ